MRNAFLHIYDYLATRPKVLWSGLVLLVLLLLAGAATLHYKEDISDFLPTDDEYRETMTAYEQWSNASRIVVIFEGGDPDALCEAVDAFEEEAVAYGFNPDLITTEVDMQSFIDRLQFVHAHAPFFLTDSDYNRLDTLFTPQGIRQALARDKQLLSMPGSGILRQVINSDPLGIFPLTIGARGQYAAATTAFASRNGYMMTSDGTMAFAFYDSPYGSTESKHNAALVDSLQQVLNSLNISNSTNISSRLLGAPVIAVANARCIKHDSMLAIGLSSILIALLLLYAFPRKRDILLILFSVSYGWLCGMAMLRLVTGEVSAIVLGIGSVIIGLAVNYPLHLLVHQRYTTSIRQTLQEVLSPLIIGNITTVGAFLALLPMQATALRDLGIFAASMLLGTIAFSVIVLPHMMSAEPTPVRDLPTLSKWLGKDKKSGSFTDKLRRITIAPVVLLVATLAFAVVLFLHRDDSRFDSNLSHINYMTEQQRADFAFFEGLDKPTPVPAYTASTAKEELRRRLTLWNNWWADKDANQLLADFRHAASEVGFREEAFEPFEENVLHHEHAGHYESLADVWPGRFDTQAMNAHVAGALSDNFNYLGLICSAIVFLFLVLSFRSLRLATIAFLPMAVAWIWILGIMQLTGLQFNIVNIILATFLFGQGDDYTIFVVEGALYERRTGKPMLPQYGQSILLSAIIMLFAIGVLLFAQHPAMHSLGAVTLIGMTCVVLMAWIIPPALINLTEKSSPKQTLSNTNHA